MPRWRSGEGSPAQEQRRRRGVAGDGRRKFPLPGEIGIAHPCLANYFRKFYQPFPAPQGRSKRVKAGVGVRPVEINAHSPGIVRVTAAALSGYQ